jgi:hypothetical protein
MDRVLSAAGQDGAPTRPPMKLELALTLLLDAHQTSLHVTALDALAAYGDTCWHSTVNALRDKGLEFVQHEYPHINRNGGTSRFQAYRLTPGSVELAETLMMLYRTGRRQTPLCWRTSPRKGD